MAETAAKAPNFEIEMYKPEQDGKPYLAHVQALVAADANRTDEQIKADEHASIRVQFPKVDEKGKPALDRHKRWFRESAAPDLSAKIVNGDGDDKGDTIEFQYIVVPKIVRPRKPKTENADAVPEADETPEADEPEKTAPKAA